MDTGEKRGSYRGGGRRGRGNRRGRYRGHASNNHYFNPHYNYENQEGENQNQYDYSQKEESYNQGHNYRGRGRGRRGGRPYRGGYRNSRGRGRGYGGQSYHQQESQPEHKTHHKAQQKKTNNPVRFQHEEYNRRTRETEQEYAYQEEKEDTRVYYQAEDFLKKYDRLPEKTEYLVKELCEATIQCAICHNEVAQIAAIWNCRQCFQPYHLGCIRKWIKKVNSEGPVNQMPYENAKEEVDEDDNPINAGRTAVRMDENGKISLETENCYSWACPNCAYNYTEPMPKYLCFCGQDSNPDHSAFYLPHSCSKTCGKKKNRLCDHASCNLECHPGACIPCEEYVEISCHCGKATRKVQCQVRAQKEHYSCRDICGKTLECFNHICEEVCHDGDCPPCKERESVSCYCGKEEKEVECGETGYSCHKICGKVLSCGNHVCQKTCHLGECGDCELLPSKVKLCPCGKTLLKSMGAGSLRKSCTDSIPTCNAICGKMLPCGTHHCKNPCHEGPCSLCEITLVDICTCGKGQRKKRCYELKYPIDSLVVFGEEILGVVQEIRSKPFTCIKKCNKIKSCKKHRCQRLCCPVTQVNDPSGAHICIDTCNKDLACGKHKCTQFCHTGDCEPCAVYSNQPLFCPCGATSIQPPVRCGEKPMCFRLCEKKHEHCEHPCGQQCHVGDCPPCSEGVEKPCSCGKMMLDNAKCGDLNPVCGQICDIKLECGHNCRKMCHDHEAYLVSDEFTESCGAKCNKIRKNCPHKCQAKCHGIDECPDEPCDAEIKIPCECGYRHVVGICNRYNEGYVEEEIKKIECNSECLKNKRDAQIAKAFKSKDEKKQKELRADYYPESLIEFGQEHFKTVVKVEKVLEEAVKSKEGRSLPDLEPGTRKYLCNLAKEHYYLEVCTYGGRFKGQKKVTDVYYKDETTQVPATLLSEYIKLIKKGIVSQDAEERKKLFEASIKIGELPIGSSLEDIKRNLIGFHSEFYTEKIGVRGGFYLHFYNKYRAEEAYKKLRSSGAGFCNIDLVDHSKPSKKRKKKKKKERDFEGFQEV